MADSATGQVLIESFEPDTSGGLLSRLAQRFSKTEAEPKCELLSVEMTPEGVPDIRIIRDLKAEAKAARKRKINFYRVTTESLPVEATVDDLTTNDGFAARMGMAGFWTVADSRLFLEKHGLGKVTPGRPLSSDDFLRWMGATVKNRIADEVSRQTFEDLRDRDALPASWIEKQAHPVCQGCGVVVKLSGVNWQSEAADRVAQQKKDIEEASHATDIERKKAEQEEQRARQTLHQVAVKKAQVDLEHEAADIRKMHAEAELRETEARLMHDKSAVEQEYLRSKMAAEKACVEQQGQLVQAFLEKSAIEREFMAEMKGIVLGMARREEDKAQQQGDLELSVCWRAFEAPESWQAGAPLKVKRESLQPCEDLSSGESLQVFVETTRDAYIYVLTLGPYLEGNTVQYQWFRLFSNGATDDAGYPFSRSDGNLLRAGERLCLPAGAVAGNDPTSRVWTLDDNYDAVETFYVLASREPIPDSTIQQLIDPVATRGIKRYSGPPPIPNQATVAGNAHDGDRFRKYVTEKLGPAVKVSEHRFFHFRASI